MRMRHKETGEIYEWNPDQGEWVRETTIGDHARAVFQGLSLGWGDEAEAFIRSLVGPESYTEERDAIRQQMQAYEQANPLTSLGLEMAGGLATGGLGGARVLAASGARRVPGLIGLGAGEGAITGAGVAQELGDIPGSAAMGATLGGALGAVAPAAERVVETGMRMWPRGRAERALRAQVGDSTPEQLTEELATLGPGGMLADIPEFQPIARSVALQPGPSQQRAYPLLRQRRAAEPERVQEALQRSTGFTGDTQRRLDELTQERRAAGEFYDQAKRYQIDISDELLPAIMHPPGKQALREAATNYKIETGRDVNIEKPQSIKDFEFWDYWKRAMDGVEGQALASNNRSRARLLAKARDLVVGSMDEQTRNAQGKSVYQQARQAYAIPSQVMDAIEEGEKVFSKSAGLASDVARKVQRMSPEQREGYLRGVVREVVRMMRGGPETAQKARKIVRYPETRDKVKAAFDNDQAFDQFMRDLDALTRQGETAAQILEGSRTAAVQAEQGAVNAPVGVVSSLAQGNIGEAVKEAARGVSAGMDPRIGGTQEYDEISRILFNMNPQANIQALQRILAEPSASFGPLAIGAAMPLIGEVAR